MSYDLAVWHEPSTIDSASAQKKYEAICTGVSVPAPHESVSRFVEALTQQHPQIDDWDDEDIDDCPWSCEFDLSPGHCIMNLRWGAVEEMVLAIVSLAKAFDLVCYDPQDGTVVQKGNAQ